MSSKATEPNVPCTSNYDNHMRTVRVSYYICIYVYMYIYIYIYVCVCVYVCVYIPWPSNCIRVVNVSMYVGPLIVGVIVVFYLA